MTARLAGLPDDRLDPSVARLFADVAAGGGSVPPVYRLLAHSPRIVQAWHAFAAPLRGPGSVPLDLKELTILRVAHATGSARQWTHHSGLATAAGVAPGTVEAVHGDLDAGPFTATQRSVLRLADELCAGGAVSDSTFAGVLGSVGAEQTVELVVLVNYYRSLAGVLAAFGLI